MTNEPVHQWVEKSKGVAPKAMPKQGVQVIRPDTRSRGTRIMELAEIMMPKIMELLKGRRDENGMLVQPGKARAIALNIAQRYVTAMDQQAGNA